MRPVLAICCSQRALAASSVEIADVGTLTGEQTEGKVLLLRHALAPGGGDPSNFDVTDCSTQRNLDQEGRDQAVELGRKLRETASGVEFSRVCS